MKKNLLNILRLILRNLAQLTIWRFEPEIIAITGSVGKTSAKEAIFAVFRDFYKIRATSENFNNELGVPLTILGNWKKISRPLLFFWLRVILLSFFRLFFYLKKFYPKILVLEYGAQMPGDIKYLLEIAKPKVAIVTAIGEIPVHVEYYGDILSVSREKSKLVEDLGVSDWAILNFDDQLVLVMKEKTRAKVLTFGFNEGADMRISNFENRSEDGKPYGISFKLEYKGNFIPVFLKGVFGKAHAYAGAIAALTGIVYEMNLIDAVEHFSSYYKPAKRRMNLTLGIKNTYIIDDSYNASPISMQKALEVLGDLEGSRKIAILGDMLELGKYSLEAHEEIGKRAAEAVDILITVGPRAKFIAEAAKKDGLHKNKVLSFDTVDEAIREVEKILKEGDIILVKASRAIELDKLVEKIRLAS